MKATYICPRTGDRKTRKIVAAWYQIWYKVRLGDNTTSWDRESFAAWALKNGLDKEGTAIHAKGRHYSPETCEVLPFNVVMGRHGRAGSEMRYRRTPPAQREDTR